MLDRMKALHSSPAADNPVSIIPSQDLPWKLRSSADTDRSALSAMDKDSTTGPDRTGVHWLLLVANSEHRVHPDLSGLEFLAKAMQTLAAGKFLSDCQPPHLRRQPHCPRKGQRKMHADFHRHCHEAIHHKVPHAGVAYRCLVVVATDATTWQQDKHHFQN